MDKKLLTDIDFLQNNFRSFYDKNPLIKEKNFKELDKYKVNFSYLQSIAIGLYTNDIKSVINNYFRKEKTSFNYKTISDMKLSYDSFKCFCNELDEIASKNTLFENTILYRGLKSNKIIDDAIERMSLIEKGFCSTTFDKDIAIEKASVTDKNDNIIDFGWLMEIYVPKGTIGCFIAENSVKPAEVEFLLPRNRNLNIFYIDYKNRILKVFDKNIYNIINK